MGPPASNEVKAFIAKHKQHFMILDNGKVKCTLNNAEFPARIEQLHSFVNGPKYKILSQRDRDWSSYEPYIIPHYRNSNLLFCLVTRINLNKKVEEVERHINAPRFKNKKVHWEQEQKKFEEKNARKVAREAGEGEQIWMPDNEDEDVDKAEDGDEAEGESEGEYENEDEDEEDNDSKDSNEQQDSDLSNDEGEGEDEDEVEVGDEDGNDNDNDNKDDVNGDYADMNQFGADYGAKKKVMEKAKSKSGSGSEDYDSDNDSASSSDDGAVATNTTETKTAKKETEKAIDRKRKLNPKFAKSHSKKRKFEKGTNKTSTSLNKSDGKTTKK